MSLAFSVRVGALGWAVVSDTSPKEAGGERRSVQYVGNTAGITTPIVIGHILQATGCSPERWCLSAPTRL
jgi:ACS family glucarate transporter-like MFS transporter